MIKIQNLSLYAGQKILLDDISFTSSSKALAILGASGSGKSLLAKCFIRLLASNLNLKANALQIHGFDSLQMKDLSLLRRQIAYIFQDAKATLPPLLDVGQFFLLCAKAHFKHKELKFKAYELFETLNLKQRDKIWHSYAHELSTGEAMRVQFSLALLLGAKVLICDELSSNLDSNNTQNLISLIKNLQKNLAFVFIAHDLDFIKELSDEVLVLEKGKIAEHLSLKDFLHAPKSLYGKDLMQTLRMQNEA